MVIDYSAVADALDRIPIVRNDENGQAVEAAVAALRHATEAVRDEEIKQAILWLRRGVQTEEGTQRVVDVIERLTRGRDKIAAERDSLRAILDKLIDGAINAGKKTK